MSGEGITGITSTKATLLTHGYCLSGRIKYREDIVHILSIFKLLPLRWYMAVQQKKDQSTGFTKHHRMTPSQPSQATAPLVELKSTVKNAFQPFVSDTLMEQISDQLAANGLLGVEMLVRFGCCHQVNVRQQELNNSLTSFSQRWRAVLHPRTIASVFMIGYSVENAGR